MKYLDVSATCRLVIKLVTEKLIQKIAFRAHEKINLTRNLSRKYCSSVRGFNRVGIAGKMEGQIEAS